MTVKIVKKKTEYKNNDCSENNVIKIDIKDVLQKMFNICIRVIEIEQLAVDDISEKRIKEIAYFSQDKYDEEVLKLERFINLYSLIFGKKYTFLEVLDKILSILNKIKNLSSEFNIILETGNNTDTCKQQNIVQEFNDEDIAILEALVADFGIQDIKDTIARHIDNLKKNENQDDASVSKISSQNEREKNRKETKIYEIL
jgi:hypothetical protein